VLHDDIITRALKQLVVGMLRSAGLRREKEAEEALLTVDELIEDLLSLTPELVDRLDVESLLTMLSPVGELDPDRSGGLAMLLEEKSRALDDVGEGARAEAARAKALLLLEAAEDAGFDPESVRAELAGEEPGDAPT